MGSRWRAASNHGTLLEVRVAGLAVGPGPAHDRFVCDQGVGIASGRPVQVVVRLRVRDGDVVDALAGQVQPRAIGADHAEREVSRVPPITDLPVMSKSPLISVRPSSIRITALLVDSPALDHMLKTPRARRLSGQTA